MRALPEQEAGQPLFTRRTDDQVGVGLARRVEVLGDVLDVQDLGELLDRATLRGLLVQQRADRVGDLAPPAVPDRDVDRDAALMSRVESAASLSRREVSAPANRSRAPTGYQMHVKLHTEVRFYTVVTPAISMYHCLLRRLGNISFICRKLKLME